MTMLQLAEEYRKSAAVIKERADLLMRERENRPMTESEKFKLKSRVDTLMAMYRDTSEVAVFMERYYDRRYRTNGRFSI